MNSYLVGGAVRDLLLGRTPGDRDYVVVGQTPEAMLAAGFKPVGKDFPVFLHPDTGEEYALARTERKSAPGYRGFTIHADPAITLEEDLARRDFTINAIAQASDGTLIDPYGGVRDIEAKVLRHVGQAFIEDPLRVLRGARFMARFAPLGFTIAAETMTLMREIADSGELDALVPERVWQELRRALGEPKPSAFVSSLRQAHALKAILPELDALYGVPQRAEYHPEIDSGRHQELVSDMAAKLAPGDALVGFAALTHDLGKALTPRAEWPRHLRHEQAGLAPVRALCERLKVPAGYRELALMVCREHLNLHRLPELRPATIHDVLTRCDAFRKPERIPRLVLACEADKRGRLGFEDTDYPQGGLLIALHAAAMAVNARDVVSPGVSGPEVGQRLRRARIQAIAAAKQAFSQAMA